MSVRYIMGDLQGWLTVKRESDDERVSLPHHLKVNYRRTAQRRDYFEALEGVHKGVDFSVTWTPYDTSYLMPYAPRFGAGRVRFNRRTNQLWYPGYAGPITAITSTTKPVPRGTFDLQIPDHPHAFGRPYLDRSPYTTAWFRILTGPRDEMDDRYLHAGANSLGCVTVQDVPKWTGIFQYLIDRRKSDVAVGTITVIG